MPKTKEPYKRRIYFIEKGFQSRFIIKFCGLVAAGGILTIVGLYALAGRSTTVCILNSRIAARTTADFLLPVLIQTVAVVTVIVALSAIAVALFVSHKIAGPLYRFKKVAQMLAEGDFSSEFKLRRPDQLQALADEFNTMIRKTKEQLNALKSHFGSLKGHLEALSEEDVHEQKRASLRDLKKILMELDKILQHFKS